MHVVLRIRVFISSISLNFIKFCKDSKGYRGCEFNPAADDEEDLINRLKRVHLDSKEALKAMEFNADDTVTQVAEQPAWQRGEDY